MAGLERQLYTRGCPPVDLLVRTSGETRLSDFLLWQSRHALLVFTQVLWPDFGFLDLAAAVQQYQRQYPTLQRMRALAASPAAAAATAVGAAAAASGDAAAWQQLPAVKLALAEGRRARGSPCSIASPASPSSPSSRSDGSEEAAAAAPAVRGPHAAAAVAAPMPSAAAATVL